MAKERVSLTDAVEGDRRGALIAIRDYIATQLEGHLCTTCLNSRLRTGDQAALILRLEKVMEEIDGLSDPDNEVSSLDALRYRVMGGAGTPPAGKGVDSESPLTGKAAQRRSGTRKPGAGRPPGSGKKASE